jgi:rod shape determining protein RodA
VVFLAGLSWKWITAFSIAGLIAMPVSWNFLHEYQRNRVRMLINPEADPLGNGWNIIQSKIAVGSGGLFGKGWLQGTQSGLDFLPEHHTDFIGAVMAEEFGFFGVLMLMLLYIVILFRGMRIAMLAKDTFSKLLAGAVTMTFCVYIVVNGGMIAGVLPVVGVPLPLVSYGGTAMVSLMAGFGILQAVYAHRRG